MVGQSIRTCYMEAYAIYIYHTKQLEKDEEEEEDYPRLSARQYYTNNNNNTLEGKLDKRIKA